MFNTGKETTIRALGRSWIVGRLELRITRTFREWVEARLPEPLTRDEFELLSPEERAAEAKRLRDVKTQLRNFSISCPLAQEYLHTEEGLGYFGKLMLSKHHPDVDEETAFEVWQEAGPQIAAAMKAAQGDPVEKKAA